MRRHRNGSARRSGGRERRCEVLPIPLDRGADDLGPVGGVPSERRAERAVVDHERGRELVVGVPQLADAAVEEAEQSDHREVERGDAGLPRARCGVDVGDDLACRARCRVGEVPGRARMPRLCWREGRGCAPGRERTCRCGVRRTRPTVWARLPRTAGSNTDSPSAELRTPGPTKSAARPIATRTSPLRWASTNSADMAARVSALRAGRMAGGVLAHRPIGRPVEIEVLEGHAGLAPATAAADTTACCSGGTPRPIGHTATALRQK